jgi:uncharacterized protein
LQLQLAFSPNNLYNFIMSQISNLYRLQQIDSQLDAAKLNLSKIDENLNDELEINIARQKVDLADDQYKSVAKILRDAENKSYDSRIKIELSEASLYGGKIHNPKELQELQNEISSLKRLMIILEDKQLEAMMEVEEAESMLVLVKQEFLDAQKNQIERNAALNGEKTKLLSQIERLNAERNAVLPTIPAPDIGVYEQLRKSKNGVAVVKIVSKACIACGTTLTAALIQSTQTTGQLVRCPTCARILYPG